ncbi:MAG: carboxypeptidase-like regulatory domain-containing protein [Acidobacteriia bacterium]|nr:carboxypeptidase-like regulatory domain-containing protein [Terriglobia bacterium]
MERFGFVTQTYSERSGGGATPISLNSGSEKDIVIKLVPQAVIAGKVVDEDGDPMPNLQIRVWRYGYNRGRRQLQITQTTSSMVDGSFMAGSLPAGKYYVSATDMRATRDFGGTNERPAKKGPVENYTRTYFPSALDVSGSAPIELAAGQDIRGVEIRMRKQQVFAIRGKLVSDAGALNSPIYLILSPKGIDAFSNLGANTRPKEGHFEFPSVPPGTYIIQSNPNQRLDPASTVVVNARYEVTVADQNIEDLSVPLAVPAEITGSFKMDADPSNTAQQSQTPPVPAVNLMVSEGVMFGSPYARANADWTFQIKNVYPAKYRVNVNGIPDGAYVKSITFGGQDVTHSELDLTSGSGGAMQIVFSPNAADISGTVRSADGNAAARVQITVWRPGSPDPPRNMLSDTSGAFKMRSLAPGDYKVAAWEDVEAGMVLDPEFLKLFEPRAQSVSLRESSHESLELKMISKDDLDAEAAKLK